MELTINQVIQLPTIPWVHICFRSNIILLCAYKAKYLNFRCMNAVYVQMLWCSLIEWQIYIVCNWVDISRSKGQLRHMFFSCQGTTKVTVWRQVAQSVSPEGYYCPVSKPSRRSKAHFFTFSINLNKSFLKRHYSVSQSLAYYVVCLFGFYSG